MSGLTVRAFLSIFFSSFTSTTSRKGPPPVSGAYPVGHGIQEPRRVRASKADPRRAAVLAITGGMGGYAA